MAKRPRWSPFRPPEIVNARIQDREYERLYADLERQLEAESRRLWPQNHEAEGRQLVSLERAAEVMGEDVDRVRFLAEAGVIYAERQYGQLYVEPVALSGRAAVPLEQVWEPDEAGVPRLVQAVIEPAAIPPGTAQEGGRDFGPVPVGSDGPGAITGGHFTEGAS